MDNDQSILSKLWQKGMFPYTPAECHARGGRDGLGLQGGNHGAIAARQGIRLDIFGPRLVKEGKVEPGIQQGPPRLPGVEALGRAEIHHVFVVGPQNERMFRPFQPVPPLSQHKLCREKLTIPHNVVPLCSNEAMAEGSTGK